MFEHVAVGDDERHQPRRQPLQRSRRSREVSYFNGGDALHGFIRASYGFPQSLGCVEMPYSEAAQVYPYTPIGTLVDVT